MYKILICDDERDIRNALRIYLTGEGYAVCEADSGIAALEIVRREEVQLVLMDIMMPGMDGMTATARLREQSNVPVILITAKGEDNDKILGLTVGADDYITKPFSLAVLRARVNAQLRRGAHPRTSCVEIDAFRFDFDRMDFRKAGRPVELSKTEQKLLRLLIENRGRTLPRAMLVDRIWTDGAEFVEENALSVTVKRLRGKLEDNPSAPKYLKTVYGIGYTWAVM